MPVMLADTDATNMVVVPKEARIDRHDRERRSVVWEEPTFGRPREGLVERLWLAARSLSQAATTCANLTLLRIQHIRVANPASPTYSVPLHQTRDRIRWQVFDF